MFLDDETLYVCRFIASFQFVPICFPICSMFVFPISRKLNAVSYVFSFLFLDNICINVVSHIKTCFFQTTSRPQKTGREVLKHWANKAEGLVPHTDAKATDQ